MFFVFYPILIKNTILLYRRQEAERRGTERNHTESVKREPNGGEGVEETEIMRKR